MVKGLGREDFNNYSWMDRANTTVINILFTFLDLDDICKDIQGELSAKSLGVGFVSQSHKIEEFSEHRRYLLSYINDVLYDISDYLEEPLYKGFHEAMDIMATIDMTDGKTDNTIGLQVDVKVSGRGMSYTNKQKMSELTLEDFIGSRYQETNGNSYVRNTYSQKVDGFANLFAKDYETYLKYSKIKQEESSLDAYLKSTVLKEFAHKKDSPFLIELLQQLSELTVVIPIYEAYKGKTLITNDNLTKTEERYKLISATVNAFTLGHGAIISKGGASLAKLFASEIIAEIAVSSTVISCEKAGVPSSVTFALALLAGAGSGAITNNVLLNKSSKYSSLSELMSPEDAKKYTEFLKNGSSSGLTDVERLALSKINKMGALNKVDADELLRLRQAELMKKNQFLEGGIGAEIQFKDASLEKFDLLRENWVDDVKANQFKNTLDTYAQQSVNMGACKSKAEFYNMYAQRKYVYDDNFFEVLKQPYLDSGASSIVNTKDIENAFTRFETIGRGEHGNFTTSMFEDNMLLYDSNGKLVNNNIIESIKGVDPGKYDLGVFQYSYDAEFVTSANGLGYVRAVDGTTPGSSSLNIPGGKTWAGDSIIYSESELLMPSIDVSQYNSMNVFSDIKKQGYFEIKNPTIICPDGTLTEIKGTFYINKIGD